jgi:hypothetical protein
MMTRLGGSEVSGHKVRYAEDLAAVDLARTLEQLRPLACIAGTTYTDSLDRQIISLTAAMGIRTVVIVDEWYNFRGRFLNPQTREPAWPDIIALPDRQAKAGAMAEGLPASRCRVTGSPALTALTDLAHRLIKSPPEIPEILTGVRDRPIVTFLSEIINHADATDPGDSGSSDPCRPTPETAVLQAILEVLGRLGQEVVTVEKLHPASESPGTPYEVPVNVDLRSTLATNLWPLLWHSDAVIGMYSMGLLEAHILGCEAVSCQPGRLGNKAATAVRLGLVAQVERREELQAWLAARLAKRREHRRVIIRHPFARADAGQRVIELALPPMEAA